MPCVILIHGAIGSGKTSTCLRLMEKAPEVGIATDGIVSIRIYREEELVGYDCLDASSGDKFPLVRLKGEQKGKGWFEFGELKYTFSSEGFARANDILDRAAKQSDDNTVIFVDEFGRLEKAELGLYSGARKVAENLHRGFLAVYSCRDDLTGSVEGLIKRYAGEVYWFEPKEFESIWSTIRRCLNNS